MNDRTSFNAGTSAKDQKKVTFFDKKSVSATETNGTEKQEPEKPMQRRIHADAHKTANRNKLQKTLLCEEMKSNRVLVKYPKEEGNCRSRSSRSISYSNEYSRSNRMGDIRNLEFFKNVRKQDNEMRRKEYMCKDIGKSSLQEQGQKENGAKSKNNAMKGMKCDELLREIHSIKCKLIC